MECRITKMLGMKLIGFERIFSSENSYEEIPKYWDELFKDRANKACADHRVGEYAVCIDDLGADKFRYLIAGRYDGGEVPDGMTLYEFPAGEWAVFECVGPLPDALQSVNTRIFEEWLPGNAEYELAGNATVEWYDCAADKNAPDYRSEIWLPVKRR